MMTKRNRNIKNIFMFQSDTNIMVNQFKTCHYSTILKRWGMKIWHGRFLPCDFRRDVSRGRKIFRNKPLCKPAKLIEHFRIFVKRNFPGSWLLYNASDNKMTCKYLRFFTFVNIIYWLNKSLLGEWVSSF
jgi:hypothetical protein